jgi:hypothetical protein
MGFCLADLVHVMMRHSSEQQWLTRVPSKRVEDVMRSEMVLFQQCAENTADSVLTASERAFFMLSSIGTPICQWQLKQLTFVGLQAFKRQRVNLSQLLNKAVGASVGILLIMSALRMLPVEAWTALAHEKKRKTEAHAFFYSLLGLFEVMHNALNPYRSNIHTQIVYFGNGWFFHAALLERDAMKRVIESLESVIADPSTDTLFCTGSLSDAMDFSMEVARTAIWKGRAITAEEINTTRVSAPPDVDSRQLIRVQQAPKPV